MVDSPNTDSIMADLSLSSGTSSLIKQSQQNTPIHSSYKPFSTPRVTTTLIPLNVCPTEYCQATKSPSTASINIVQNHKEQKIYEHKSDDSVITHFIDDWIIRERSKPFRQKETKQLTNLVQKIVLNEPKTSRSPLPLDVNQWTVDDVCSFFERVLGKNCFTSVIQEHLIDGVALLLLEDEHLVSIFQMPLGPRLKLLDRIQKLKKGDFSAL
ncbi:unnamed protein product [Adineta ricciae]|uniref:SAM domain-containing protein n=1 Tax=Adineta ricciae TaxID=249248 RepID=A0A814Y5I2_ADIRI|nr:unnamed protein product [Adineta ricciae]